MANSSGWGDGAANNAIGWGQGANNNIGWGDSHSKSWAGLTDIVGLDSSASAFISAAGITDATQISAINNLVVGMKSDGIWTKMKAIYPFVGGTASTHKYNLKDPRDLDAAFRLVFNGGWTHSSNGATPNGTNGYADTKLNISSEFTSQTQAFSLYTPVSNTTSNVLGGVTNGVSTTQFFNPIGQYNILGTGYVKSSAMSNGFILMSQPSANNTSAYEKGVKLGTFTQATSALMNLNYYIAARNFSNTADSYANRQLSFAHIGNGLTDTEASNLYTRVQAFQTALSRQV
jgi:hypothetical protein